MINIGSYISPLPRKTAERLSTEQLRDFVKLRNAVNGQFVENSNNLKYFQGKGFKVRLKNFIAQFANPRHSDYNRIAMYRYSDGRGYEVISKRITGGATSDVAKCSIWPSFQPWELRNRIANINIKTDHGFLVTRATK